MERPVFIEDETPLMEYFNIIWKRKWLILIPTFIFIVAVGIYSFIQPKAWEVDAMILPSKFFIQTAQGEFREVAVADPIQISTQINENSYDSLIAAELNINIRGFPKLKAENIKDTSLIRISTKVSDVNKAKQILYSLFNHLKRDLDKKIEVEIKGLDTQIESQKNIIKSKEIEIEDKKNTIKLKELSIEDKKNEMKTKQNRIKDKENLIKTKGNAIKLKNNEIKIKNLSIQGKESEKEWVKEEINTFNNKLKISEERETTIKEEMKKVKDRINDIEKEQRNVLKNKNKKNSISILLYSNEIQNNLRYYNSLDENLTNEKINQENINLAIEEKKERIKSIDYEIELIRTEIQDIETEIDNVNTQISDIHTQIDDINTQIDNIKNEIGKINNEISSIQNGITIINNEIENVRNQITLLEEKKARMDYAQLIKEPTVSLFPVAPKKKRNILIATILGLIIFTTLAFLIENIEKYKLIYK